MLLRLACSCWLALLFFQAASTKVGPRNGFAAVLKSHGWPRPATRLLAVLVPLGETVLALAVLSEHDALVVALATLAVLLCFLTYRIWLLTHRPGKPCGCGSSRQPADRRELQVLAVHIVISAIYVQACASVPAPQGPLFYAVAGLCGIVGALHYRATIAR